MTSILADARLGFMAADSSISDGDRVWLGRKVWRIKGALIGFAGDCDEAQGFLAWWRGGCVAKTPHFGKSYALVLQASGLLYFGLSCIPQPVKSGIEAIGSGSKAAICAYEALGFDNIKRAVALACKHDAGSRSPVRTYTL